MISGNFWQGEPTPYLGAQSHLCPEFSCMTNPSRLLPWPRDVNGGERRQNTEQQGKGLLGGEGGERNHTCSLNFRAQSRTPMKTKMPASQKEHSEANNSLQGSVQWTAMFILLSPSVAFVGMINAINQTTGFVPRERNTLLRCYPPQSIKTLIFSGDKTAFLTF